MTGRDRGSQGTAAAEFPAFPEPLAGHLSLVTEGPQTAAEAACFAEIADRIQRAEFELPRLPETSVTILKLTNQPAVEVEDVARVLETDPVLSAELLRLANSVLFGGTHPAHTLQQAVIRLGLRQIRALVLSFCVRHVIFRSRALMPVAEELWRQTHSMGVLARRLALGLGLEPDRGFLIGQLHDIGKIPLLELMRELIPASALESRPLVGRIFRSFHEQAGSALARAWNLPEELVSVAGNHHLYRDNLEAPEAAALASLVHRLDLRLASGDEAGFWDLRLADEWQLLHASFEERRELLTSCLGEFTRE